MLPRTSKRAARTAGYELLGLLCQHVSGWKGGDRLNSRITLIAPFPDTQFTDTLGIVIAVCPSGKDDMGDAVPI